MRRSNVFDCFASLLACFFTIAIGFGVTSASLAQDRGDYSQGEDNRLEMVVHIIGEVKKPGKFRVRDDTNLIELLSEAGGPTEFSNLNIVTITHVKSDLSANGQNATNRDKATRIMRYNINKYLKEENASPAPILEPGDVVLVPKNKWGTWRSLATIARDISVVASAYFLYLRATRD